MPKVWCTCYKCQENIEGGAYVSKVTCARHHKLHQQFLINQENGSIDVNETVNITNQDNDIDMVDTFKYVIYLDF